MAERMTDTTNDSIGTTAPDATNAADDHEADGWEWAVVEIFGHRRHAGRIREEERFGTKMLRIDVPTPAPDGSATWATHWYGGASVFSLTLADEATVLRLNRPYAAAARYLAPPADIDGGGDFDDPEA